MLIPRALGAFACSRRGNVAMITGLLMPVFVISAAIAVDTAKIFSSKRQLQQSLDAAALAAGKQYGTTRDPVELTRWAKGFFLANAGSQTDQNTQFSYDGVTVQNGTTVLKVSATRDEPTYFGHALYVVTGGKLNQETWPLSVSSQIAIANRSVELALVLDNSGSMKNAPSAGGTVKITALKTAATQLISQVLTTSTESNVTNPVKLGIVPFSGAVNVGPQYADAKWMDTQGLSSSHNDNFDWSTWTATVAGVKVQQAIKVVGSNTAWRKITTLEPLTRFYLFKNMKTSSGALRFPDGWEGCVESRPNGLAITDTAPSASNPDTYYVPLFAPSEYFWDNNVYGSFRDDYITDPNAKTPPSSDLVALKRQVDMNRYFDTTLATKTGTDTVKEGPNFVCNTTAITPLTANATTAKAAITAMQPLGATNIPEGLAWGWRVLSSNEPFTQGVAANTENNLKVLVLMTDGENTYNPTYSNGSSVEFSDSANAAMFGTFGFGQILNAAKTAIVTGRMFDATKTTTKKAAADNYVAALNEMTTSVCENIKADGKVGTADGIVIFTIAFDLADTSPIKQRLKACASSGMDGSSAKLYYDVKSSADLLAAFAAITSQISSLRVAH